ncbi:MAG: ABC transporter permease, partial [Mesorhizobium sp.]
MTVARAASSRRSFLGHSYNLVGVVASLVILAWTLVAIFAPYIIPHPIGDIVDDDYFGPMRQGLWLGSDYLGLS